MSIRSAFAILPLVFFIGLAFHAGAAEPGAADGEVWVPPGPGALDAKRDFGAVGDGKADDTAALQKALDALRASSDTNGPSTLVLLPGTYRITATLRMTSHFMTTVTGLDPATTRLVWDGPKTADPAREAVDGIPWPAMILANGVRWTVISRLTFDGRGSQAVGFYHAWDGQTPGAGTWNRHEDITYTDLHAGLFAGRSGPSLMDAETVVTRCTFRRCTGAGIVINSFNVLDWWVWHCRFEDNALGITNQLPGTYGGGHFHVYESLFQRSTVSDLQTGNCSYFGIRGNRSEGSQMFLRSVRPTGWGPEHKGRWADTDTWGSTIHLQRNTILDSKDATPIRMTDSSSLLLTDNVVRRPADAAGKPWAECTGPGASAFVAIGNCVAPAGGYRAGQVVDIAGSMELPADLPMPAAVGVIASAASGPFIDVAPGGDAAALQAALDKAGTLRGQHAVVRVPAGTWSCAQGFTIPAGADLILVGDGSRTRLVRTTAGAVLTIPAGSPVTVRDLQLGAEGEAAVTGLACTTKDEPDSGLWTDQIHIAGKAIGMDLAGLTRGRVELRNHQFGSEQVGMRLRGGRTWLFGGATSNCGDMYRILDGAVLVIRDIWYEGAPATWLVLTDKGRMTVDCGKTAPGRPNFTYNPKAIGIDLRDFTGSLALIGFACETTMRRTGTAEVALLGTLFDEAYQMPFTDEDKRVISLGNYCRDHSAQRGLTGNVPLPTIGAERQDDLLRLLADTRAAKPAPPGPGMVRLIRVTTGWNIARGITLNVP